MYIINCETRPLPFRNLDNTSIKHIFFLDYTFNLTHKIATPLITKSRREYNTAHHRATTTKKRALQQVFPARTPTPFPCDPSWHTYTNARTVCAHVVHLHAYSIWSNTHSPIQCFTFVCLCELHDRVENINQRARHTLWTSERRDAERALSFNVRRRSGWLCRRRRRHTRNGRKNTLACGLVGGGDAYGFISWPKVEQLGSVCDEQAY